MGKMPSRYIGVGISYVPMIAPMAYASEMAAVARRLDSLRTKDANIVKMQITKDAHLKAVLETLSNEPPYMYSETFKNVGAKEIA